MFTCREVFWSSEVLLKTEEIGALKTRGQFLGGKTTIELIHSVHIA